MGKSQYELCLEVLRRLEGAGVLKDVILIGSWCMSFYRDYFSSVAYSPSIKTRDIDFLVPRPGAVRSKADIPELMKDIGFIKGFRGREGYLVLEHPDLAIEFLVPEKGRGTDKPVFLPYLGLNAQALRFLELLSRNTIRMKIDDFSLMMPHPVNFALHKLIISKRRRDKDKSAKDREAALGVLRTLIQKKKGHFIRNVFRSLPVKWQRTVLKELETAEENRMIEILSKP